VRLVPPCSAVVGWLKEGKDKLKMKSSTKNIVYSIYKLGILKHEREIEDQSCPKNVQRKTERKRVAQQVRNKKAHAEECGDDARISTI
jgi:hypothetical protein